MLKRKKQELEKSEKDKKSERHIETIREKKSDKQKPTHTHTQT